jgi:cytoskeletal protein CcmA (bactofilin family)
MAQAENRDEWDIEELQSAWPSAPSVASVGPSGDTRQNSAAEAAASTETPRKEIEMAQTVQEKRTVVEEGTRFKGTLESDCPIVVNGRIEGEVEAPSMTVSATGAVHGKAKVGSIRSEGELSGEFDAQHVELAGSVCDNTVIRAEKMEVKLSAKRGKMQVIFGECEPEASETTSPAEATRSSQPPGRRTDRPNGQSQPPLPPSPLD